MKKVFKYLMTFLSQNDLWVSVIQRFIKLIIKYHNLSLVSFLKISFNHQKKDIFYAINNIHFYRFFMFIIPTLTTI